MGVAEMKLKQSLFLRIFTFNSSILYLFSLKVFLFFKDEYNALIKNLSGEDTISFFKLLRSNLDIGKKCNYNGLWYTSHTQTIAITTEASNWKSVEKIDGLKLRFDEDKENNKRPYTNKYVEMYNATINMSLIGVHLNSEEEYWKKLTKF